jgi:hypothetical protein
MTIIDSEPEYAVEVPGRGFSRGSFVMEYLGDEPTYGVDLDDAKKRRESLAKHYDALGCPEVAVTVRVVQRTVEVTRGDWEPYEEMPPV